jgi:D-arabinose 1-dehydrogenase-like Zn-dependent alcohol dehydrogenase
MAPRAKVFPLAISMEPLGLLPLSLITGGLIVSVSGMLPIASVRAMPAFAAEHGIKPHIQKFPMTQHNVTEAMQKWGDGKMRYRGVLVVP